jgi:hypothetical protein
MGGHSRGGGGRLVQESNTNGLPGDCAKLVVMEGVYVGQRVSRVKKGAERGVPSMNNQQVPGEEGGRYIYRSIEGDAKSSTKGVTWERFVRCGWGGGGGDFLR